MCCFFRSELRSGITQFGQVQATRRTRGFTSWSLLTLMFTFTEVWLIAGWCVTIEGVTLMVVVVVVLVSLEDATMNGAGCIVTWLADDVAVKFFEAGKIVVVGAIDETCVITGRMVVWWLCVVTEVFDWLVGADDAWIITGDDCTISGFTIHFVVVSCSGLSCVIVCGVIVMVWVCVGCDATGVEGWAEEVDGWLVCVWITGDCGICWIVCMGWDMKFPFNAFAEITWTLPIPGMCWIWDGTDWSPGKFGIWMMFWFGRICWAGMTVICCPCAFVIVIGCWAACVGSCPLPSTFICWDCICCAACGCWNIGIFASCTCWIWPDGVMMFAYCCVNCGTICICGWMICGIWLPKFWIGMWTVW